MNSSLIGRARHVRRVVFCDFFQYILTRQKFAQGEKRFVQATSNIGWKSAVFPQYHSQKKRKVV